MPLFGDPPVRETNKNKRPDKLGKISGDAIGVGAFILALALVIVISYFIAPSIEQKNIGFNTEFMDLPSNVQVEKKVLQ